MVKINSQNNYLVTYNFDEVKLTITQINLYLYCIYELLLNILNTLTKFYKRSNLEIDYILNYNNFISEKNIIIKFINEINNITKIKFNNNYLFANDNKKEIIFNIVNNGNFSKDNLYNSFKLQIPNINISTLKIDSFYGMITDNSLQNNIIVEEIDEDNEESVVVEEPNGEGEESVVVEENTNLVSNTTYQSRDIIEGHSESAGLGHCVDISSDGSVIAGAARNEGGYVVTYKLDHDSNTYTDISNNQLFKDDDYSEIESISLSGDGTILAIGFYTLNKVKIFKYENNTWTNIGTLSEDNETGQYGQRVSLSYDGTRIAVGARNATVDITPNIGKVYIYNKNIDINNDNISWSKINEIHGLNQQENNVSEFFSQSLHISGDGNRVAVGASDYNESGEDKKGYVQIFEIVGDNTVLTSPIFSRVGDNVSTLLSGWGVVENAIQLNYYGTRIAIGCDCLSTAESKKIIIFDESSNSWPLQDADPDLTITDSSNIGGSISMNLYGDIIAATSEQGDGYTKIYKIEPTIDDPSILTYTLITTINSDVSGDQPWACALNDDGNQIIVGYRSHDTNDVQNVGKLVVYDANIAIN